MEQCVQAARDGDRRALEELVREHYDRVYRFCARRLGEDRAWDAAQETFVILQKRLRSFRGESRFEVWLFGLANNVCRNLARKHRLELDAADAWLDDQAAAAEGCPVDAHCLREAIAKLSPEHREVVLLHEVEGFTYEEIGRAIGVPTGTVKSRLHHAFVNLRRSLSAVSEASA